MYFLFLPQCLEGCPPDLRGLELFTVVLCYEPVDDGKQPEKRENGDEVGKWQFWKLNGYVITKPSCRKGEGDIFCAGKGAPEKRERKKFGPTKGILVPVS